MNVGLRSGRQTCLAAWFWLFVGSGGWLAAAPLTLPCAERPEWVSRDGIVMAGSWEPLLFRVRRDGSDGYTPTAAQQEAYRREHSAEMVSQLKALGVNFVMMHCYKAFGLDAEQESMADAVRFAKLCHDAGLRVGVYNSSGTLGWELLFKERPAAKDWVVLDADGNPRTYGRATYRYYWNRNHPAAVAFHRGLVDFAVQQIGADLLHFDNYVVGPGADANSVARFREYLARQFSAAQLAAMGAADTATIQPPLAGPPDNLLRRAWLEFSCRSLADSYHEMCRYARSLKKDILVECNPGGIHGRMESPIDHGRLLQGGEAFWDEGPRPGYHAGQLRTRIRTYKVARRMGNMAFAYATNPLEMAESMAFNRDCLGCICWFEYNEIVQQPGSDQPLVDAIEPFVRFFHQRRDLLRDAQVIADVAVLRSFPSQLFADPEYAKQTVDAEDALIQGRVPFQIIYDHQLDDLARYQVLVLAGCVALADRHLELIRAFARSGGRVCSVGPVGSHDPWLQPRNQPVVVAEVAQRHQIIPDPHSVVAAVQALCGDQRSVSIEAPDGVCMELTAQPGRRLVHLVNYRVDQPAAGVAVRLRLPSGQTAKRVTLASPSRGADREVAFQQQNGSVAFTVPSVGVYEVAVVAFE
ncbi:MAG: hypothetical protein A2W31_18640 [Planctomycetes bacterium RBG_16_64_10]|nr:MAG: hypothetical protein A2W31_18640 [Planctomycetes bacterium RBG_16_64_10]